MTPEIERDYWRRLYAYLALTASLLSSTITNIGLCDEVQKDADSSLDEIGIARLLEERELKLRDKAQALMLDIMEFKIKNTKPVSPDSIDAKFGKSLEAVSEESRQCNSICDELEKMVKERCKI